MNYNVFFSRYEDLCVSSNSSKEESIIHKEQLFIGVERLNSIPIKSYALESGKLILTLKVKAKIYDIICLNQKQLLVFALTVQPDLFSLFSISPFVGNIRKRASLSLASKSRKSLIYYYFRYLAKVYYDVVIVLVCWF